MKNKICLQSHFIIHHKSDLNCIRKHNLKIIQILTEQFDSLWSDSIGSGAFKNCPEKRCYALRYKPNSQIPLEESDGVMVHVPNLYRIPSRDSYYRKQSQLWYFYTLESQRLSLCLRNFKIHDLDDWFNLTKTVKSEYSYFSYDIKQLDRYKAYQNAFKRSSIAKSPKNKKLAFWFVSNCNGFSQRREYVNELQKYIEIDIYGKCNFNNSKPDPCLNAINQITCFRELFNLYKFYLSFENSKCNYYITEKYFKFYYDSFIFDVDLIPVVRGAKLDHYLKRAPSNYSFIYADSFPSPKFLANYLIYLDGNQTAYEEYFNWKRELKSKLKKQKSNIKPLKPNYFFPLCDLCEKLHDVNYLKSTHPVLKISEFYNPVRDCERDKENQTENELLKQMEDNCYWAEFQQNVNQYHNLEYYLK